MCTVSLCSIAPVSTEQYFKAHGSGICYEEQRCWDTSYYLAFYQAQHLWGLGDETSRLRDIFGAGIVLIWKRWKRWGSVWILHLDGCKCKPKNHRIKGSRSCDCWRFLSWLEARLEDEGEERRRWSFTGRDLRFVYASMYGSSVPALSRLLSPNQRG